MCKDFDYKKLRVKVGAPPLEKGISDDFPNPSKKKHETRKWVYTSSAATSKITPPSSLIDATNQTSNQAARAKTTLDIPRPPPPLSMRDLLFPSW